MLTGWEIFGLSFGFIIAELLMGGLISMAFIEDPDPSVHDLGNLNLFKQFTDFGDTKYDVARKEKHNKRIQILCFTFSYVFVLILIFYGLWKLVKYIVDVFSPVEEPEKEIEIEFKGNW